MSTKYRSDKKDMDAFDYAAIIGHGAFDELSMAAKIALINHLDISKLNLEELFAFFNDIRRRRNEIILPLVKAISLFQTNMEALISHYELITKSKLSKDKFVDQWKRALVEIGCKHDFEPYGNFYENYRITLIHFKYDAKKNTLQTVRSLEFIDVYNGIKSGWEAFDALSGALGRPNDADSWQTMCRAHELPISVTANEYPRLKKLSQDVWQEWQKKGSVSAPTP
jgi:hypothetical protein